MTTTINASNSGSGGLIQTADISGILALQTANTTAVTIDASQNVGIGTTTPAYKFDVVGDINIPATSSYKLGTASVISYSGGNVSFGDAGGNLFVKGTGFTGFYTAATERMRIDSSGNVGIGTTSPSTKFHVAGSTAIARIDRTADASANPELQLTAVGRQFNVGVGGATFATAALQGSYYLYDSTASAYRMVIDVNGNVGIGTSSPNNIRLNVDSGAANYSTAFIKGSGALPDNNDNAVLYVLNSGTAGTGLRVRTDQALTGTNFAHILVNNSSASINGLQVSQYGTGYIASFDKSGTVVFRVDNTGNLGVGTSPSYPLHVVAALGRVYLQSSTGTNYASYTVNNTGGNFQFGIDNSAGSNYFGSTAYGRAIFSDGAYPIGIFTNGTERMRIDSSGNVGINTTSPGAKLGISMPNNPGGTPGIKVTMAGGGAGASADAVGIDLVLSGLPNYDTTYGIRSVISGGGTGQAAYAGWFKGINGNSNTPNTGVYVEMASTGSVGLAGDQYAVYAYANSAASGVAGSNWALAAVTSNQVHGKALYVNDAYSTAGSKTLAQFNRAGTLVGTISTSLTATSYNTSSTSGLIGVDASTVAFNTASSERMRIDSSGNVGIGTTSPSSYLSGSGVAVYRATGDSQIALSTGTTSNAASVRLYNTTNAQAEIAAGGSTYSAWGGANSLNFLALQNSGAMTFNTTASSTTAERMRINAFGVGLGGAAPSSGTGIMFPASQSASTDPNTLDDYEEGTFTPNLVNNGSSSTFTVKNGYYRKIGSLVICWVDFDSGNSGTAGTTLQVTGLPFTMVTGPRGAMNGGFWGANGLATNNGGFDPQGNTTTANVYIGGGIVSSQTTYLSGTIIYMASA